MTQIEEEVAFELGMSQITIQCWEKYESQGGFGTQVALEVSMLLLNLEKHVGNQNALWFEFMEEIQCGNPVNGLFHKKSSWLYTRGKYMYIYIS